MNGHSNTTPIASTISEVQDKGQGLPGSGVKIIILTDFNATDTEAENDPDGATDEEAAEEESRYISRLWL